MKKLFRPTGPGAFIISILLMSCLFYGLYSLVAYRHEQRQAERIVFTPNSLSQ